MIQQCNPRQSWILDFTLWIPCQWKLDSGLQSLAGSGIREQDFLTHAMYEAKVEFGLVLDQDISIKSFIYYYFIFTFFYANLGFEIPL